MTRVARTESNQHATDQARMKRTLPSDASSSFTGPSRTAATKQYDAGWVGDADGNHAVLRTGAACKIESLA